MTGSSGPSGAERTGAAPRLGYMPGVDGLRAIAVAGVLAYHLGAGWLPGGFLGVDLFFVISGYLITSLLLAERRASGRIDLLRFWGRRARRLLPAVFAMLIVVLMAMVVLHAGEVARLHAAVLASAGYVANWYFAFAHVPYFARFGRPSVFEHLWSLAVEEQFYIVWPLVMAALLVVWKRPRALLVLVVCAIAGSTVLAALLWKPFADPSRIYYGTDTRAVGLLAGVALALVLPAHRRTRETARPGLEVIGLLSLAGVLALMATLGDLDEWLYRGGFLAVALAAACLVAVASHPGSRFGHALGVAPLVWIGLRSYSIYLWHWPVILLTRPHVDVDLDGWALVVVRLGLIVALAALSYRFVEVPFRRLGPRGVWGEVSGRARGLPRPVRLAAAGSVATALVALLVAVAVLPGQSPSIPGLAVASAAGASPAGGASPPTDPASANGSAAPGGRKPRVVFVGDSVMLGASSVLREAFGSRAAIDARVGRQFDEGSAAVLADLRGRRPASTVVVIHLGDNGFIDFDDLERLMRDLRPYARVVLVTVRVPLQWQDSVNDALRSVHTRYRNTVIADWHSVSGGPGSLVDGVHTTPAGARLYVRTIARAVRRPALTTGGPPGR